MHTIKAMIKNPFKCESYISEITLWRGVATRATMSDTITALVTSHAFTRLKPFPAQTLHDQMPHKPISPPSPPPVCHSTGWKCGSGRKQKHSRGDTSVTRSRGAAVAPPTQQDDEDEDEDEGVRGLPDLLRQGDAAQLRV